MYLGGGLRKLLFAFFRFLRFRDSLLRSKVWPFLFYASLVMEWMKNQHITPALPLPGRGHHRFTNPVSVAVVIDFLCRYQ